MRVKRNIACSFVALLCIGIQTACISPVAPQPATTQGISHISSEPAVSTPATSTMQPDSTEEPGEIVNLPDELQVSCQSTYAGLTMYSFDLKEPRQFEIDIVNDNGTIELGIQDRATKTFVLPSKEYATEVFSLSLEPGSYSVVMHMSAFYGSYHIRSEASE